MKKLLVGCIAIAACCGVAKIAYEIGRASRYDEVLSDEESETQLDEAEQEGSPIEKQETLSQEQQNYAFTGFEEDTLPKSGE